MSTALNQPADETGSAVVTADGVAAFTAATLAYGTAGVPPLYAARLAAPVLRRVLAGALAGGPVIHVAQELVSHAPLETGQLVSVRGRVAEVVDFGFAPAMVVEVDIASAGRLLLTSTSTMLLHGRERVGRPAPRVRRTAFGDQLAVTEVALPSDLATRYAEASGDDNPIHIDETAARAAGLPGVVVHGMCVLAVAWAATERTLRRAPVAASCRFSRPVTPGADLAVRLCATASADAVAAEVSQHGHAVLKNATFEFS